LRSGRKSRQIKDRCDASHGHWQNPRPWLDRSQDGPFGLPPIQKSPPPQTTAPEVVERFKALALEHPAYGCNRIKAMMALEGRRVSAITVQKILHDHDLGSRPNCSNFSID
jgi:hypothetical protein